MYSGTSLIQTPLGQISGVVMYTCEVFGTAKCVLFIEVSSFQGVLIKTLCNVGEGVAYLGAMETGMSLRCCLRAVPDFRLPVHSTSPAHVCREGGEGVREVRVVRV